MRLESVQLFIEAIKEAGVETVVAMPESDFKELYPALAADTEIRYLPVSNENVGASIAAGMWAGGKKAILIMENTGIRMGAESLSRMGLTHGLPVVMLMPYRGEIGEPNWWGIEHGITMEPILKALRIPYEVVREEDKLKSAIKRAIRHASVSLYHVAVVVGREVIHGQ